MKSEIIMFVNQGVRGIGCAALAVFLWIALAAADPAGHRPLSPDPGLGTRTGGNAVLPEPNDADMSPSNGVRKPADPAVRHQFIAGYNLSSSNRKLFERYLNTLGAVAMLDHLEERFPHCHAEAHELGQAIYADRKDIGVALGICGWRCTSGCMHGVVREAFRDRTIDEVKADVESFCLSGTMSGQYKPGNCAHGLGHALMIISGRDLSESLDACAAFPSQAMAYYCATGVYMEYFAEPEEVDRKTVGLHYPCDINRRYPAACYRYYGRKLLNGLRRNPFRLAKVCREIQGRVQRLGCFHGLGRAMQRRIAEKPHTLGVICGQGSADDQAVCIEGAIEKLADFDQSSAFEACTSLREKNADICKAAAREKMYRLNKPTLPLYIRP